jgi:glutamate synthase domain-containing protein 3
VKDALNYSTGYTAKGPVLCFAGPPGTGKTSIGQVIARAMGRKFVCFSMAGLRDEAELKGMIEKYIRYTNSKEASDILSDWESSKKSFIKVMPVDYKRVLKEQAQKAREV